MNRIQSESQCRREALESTIRSGAVKMFHASVSGCHSASLFGDEESIDKNRPKINRTARIAPISIQLPPPSAVNACKCDANVSRCESLTGAKRFDHLANRLNHERWLVEVDPMTAVGGDDVLAGRRAAHELFPLGDLE